MRGPAVKAGPLPSRRFYSAASTSAASASGHSSLAAGYCAVAKQYGKQPAKANAEPYARPLIIPRAFSSRLGADARSSKRRDALAASPDALDICSRHRVALAQP